MIDWFDVNETAAPETVGLPLLLRFEVGAVIGQWAPAIFGAGGHWVTGLPAVLEAKLGKLTHWAHLNPPTPKVVQASESDGTLTVVLSNGEVWSQDKLGWQKRGLPPSCGVSP